MQRLACTFFNQLQDFRSEQLLYEDSILSTTLPRKYFNCDNQDRAITSQSGFAYPPFMVRLHVARQQGHDAPCGLRISGKHTLCFIACSTCETVLCCQSFALHGAALITSHLRCTCRAHLFKSLGALDGLACSSQNPWPPRPVSVSLQHIAALTCLQTCRC